MTKDIKKRSLHRAKIIRGQLDGLIEMIEADDYCVDIMTQSLAIQRALRSLNKLVMENHLNTHVKSDLASGNPGLQNKAIKELSMLYELNNVRGK